MRKAWVFMSGGKSGGHCGCCAEKLRIPMVQNRKNGGVVLGKTNLSEWANIRSNNSTSGWSGVGGLTRNPYAIDRNSCGSSSGSTADTRKSANCSGLNCTCPGYWRANSVNTSGSGRSCTTN